MRAEQNAAADPLPQTAVVGAREQSGSRSVNVVFDVAVPPPPLIAGTGLVTALNYKPGAEVGEGDPLLELDGVIIRAHRGSRPFYRAIDSRTTGKDVTELGRYLSANGFKVATAAGGTLSSESLKQAIRAYQDKIGAPVDGVFEPGYVIHLNEQTKRLTSASVAVGQPVSAGTEFAAGDTVAQHVAFTSPTGEFVSLRGPGPYKLSDSDQFETGLDSLEFDEVAAEKLRSALTDAGTSSSGPDDVSPQQTFHDLTLSAGAGTQVGAVPTSAVHAAADGSFCVFRLAEGAPLDSAEAVKLQLAGALERETTLAAIDFALVGESVARVAADVPKRIQESCK